MKTKFLIAIIAFAFTGVVNAQCTVTTGCGQTGTYPAGTSVSVDSRSTPGFIIVTNQATGAELQRFECNQRGGISINGCGSITTGGGDTTGNGDGDFDICDFLVFAPQSVKDQFGCN